MNIRNDKIQNEGKVRKPMSKEEVDKMIAEHERVLKEADEVELMMMKNKEDFEEEWKEIEKGRGDVEEKLAEHQKDD